MAHVRVEQRNAHLAGPVRLETVAGRDGEISRAVLTAISNSKRGRGESREDEPTAIQWTLWGQQAENAAQYLGKGSHVNAVGRLRNNHYKDDAGNTVFGFSFTCEEIDYLDSKAEADARRAKESGEAAKPAQPPAAESKPNGRSRGQVKPPKAAKDDDIPF